MTSLYLLSPTALILLPLLLAAALLLQSWTLVQGFYQVRYRRFRLPEFMLEWVVWFYLILHAGIAAQAIYQIDCGFVAAEPYIPARWCLYALLLILSIALSFQRRRPCALSAPAIGLLTLPTSAHLTHLLPAGIFPLAIMLWGLRALCRLRSYRSEKLSAASVKEALDTMGQGLMFFQSSGLYAGQILLANRSLQELMFALTGTLMYNGTQFCRMLEEQDVLDGCRRCGTDDHLIYELADGSVWEFKIQPITLKHTLYTLLTASDITTIWQATEALNQQNLELEARNQQLKQMLLNLEFICSSEETIRLKSLVHDLLGQKITVLLRSVREHRELDESLLRSFTHGLSEELKNASPDYGHSLKRLIADFRGLGVQVRIQGNAPERSSLRKVFYEITAEALTNAVRHGYATQIDIQVQRERGALTLTISDNGIPSDEPLIEGGGLSSMRRRVRELGGTFRYETKPHFQIFINIPEEDGS